MPAETLATNQADNQMENLTQGVAHVAPIEPNGGNNGKRYFLIFLLVLVLLGLVGGGIYVYRRAMTRRGVVEATPTPEVYFKETQEATPTPTPEEELNRADLKIEVLNGSGVAGLAGKAAEYLEGLGYEDIKTGNADNYDYEQTEIAIKEDKQNYLSMIRKDLEDKYPPAEEVGTLEDDSDFDVVITLGQE